MPGYEAFKKTLKADWNDDLEWGYTRSNTPLFSKRRSFISPLFTGIKMVFNGIKEFIIWVCVG